MYVTIRFRTAPTVSPPQSIITSSRSSSSTKSRALWSQPSPWHCLGPRRQSSGCPSHCEYNGHQEWGHQAHCPLGQTWRGQLVCVTEAMWEGGWQGGGETTGRRQILSTAPGKPQQDGAVLWAPWFPPNEPVLCHTPCVPAIPLTSGLPSTLGPQPHTDSGRSGPRTPLGWL